MRGYHVVVKIKNLNDAYRLFDVVRDTTGYKGAIEHQLNKFNGDLCYSIMNGVVCGWCYEEWYKHSTELDIYTVEEFLNRYGKSKHKTCRRTYNIEI